MKRRFSRRMKHLFLSLVILLILVGMCVCLGLGSLEVFEAYLSKMGISLGGRALSFALWKVGLPGGFALIIGFWVRFLITEGASEIGVGPRMMDSSDSDSGAASSSSWTRALFGSISSETETGGTSVNQGVARPVPPANPVASGEAEAGPSHVVPFPYDDEEVIGGDSVLSIQRRLLSKNDSPSAHEITMARIEAQDLMEVKVEIVRLMAPRDPEGDWDRQGARALDNMRRATGEESLEKLVQLRERIKEGDEAAIRSFKSKMIGRRRRDEDAASSA